MADQLPDRPTKLVAFLAGFFVTIAIFATSFIVAVLASTVSQLSTGTLFVLALLVETSMVLAAVVRDDD